MNHAPVPVHDRRTTRGRRASWLDQPPTECPVDTVVELYLENRSGQER